MHLVQTAHLLYPLLIHILLLIEWTKNLEGTQYRYLSRIFMFFLHKTEEKNIHLSWDSSVCPHMHIFHIENHWKGFKGI